MPRVEPHITPVKYAMEFALAGYPQAASDVLAKMLTEAHRFMHYLYIYLLTTDLTLLSFLVQK